MEKTKKWKNLITYLVIAIIFYITLRYLFGAIFPFVLAYLLLKLLYPIAAWIKKRLKIKTGISMAVLVFLIVGIIGCLLWWLFSSLFQQFSSVFRNVDSYQGKVDGILADCCGKIEHIFGLKVEYVKPYLLSRFYSSVEKLGESITSGIMAYTYQYAKSMIKIIGVIIIVIVSTIVMAKDYDRLLDLTKKTSLYKNVKTIKDKVLHAGVVYLRAQLVLLCITSAICVISLKIVGLRNALLIGTSIGLMDALPFLGTGAVLVPWAIIKVFRGEFLYASVFISIYLICSFVREFMEPKLIGKNLGIPSLFVIASIYIGIVLYGIPGVVLGPLHVALTMETGKQWIKDHS